MSAALLPLQMFSKNFEERKRSLEFVSRPWRQSPARGSVGRRVLMETAVAVVVAAQSAARSGDGGEQLLEFC